MSSPAPVTPVAAPPSASNPSTAEAMVAANSSSSLTSSSTITSLADLKRKAPQVYNMMMQGIAMQICDEMQKHQQRLKQMMRQGEQQA